MLVCQPHDVLLQVEDPSKYGVVVMDGQGVVERFVEKPKVHRPAASPSHCGAWVSSARTASGHHMLLCIWGPVWYAVAALPCCMLWQVLVCWHVSAAGPRHAAGRSAGAL